jgi:hypothetical protein
MSPEGRFRYSWAGLPAAPLPAHAVPRSVLRDGSPGWIAKNLLALGILHEK